MTTTHQSLTDLRADLISAMDIEQVFQKHIVDGPSYFFGELLNEKNTEYALRHSLAQHLGVSINDVIIVGSAKLGFSVKTEKFLKFDERYVRTDKKKNKSDIDVAIISRSLFDQETKLIFEISRHFDGNWEYSNWRHNLYYTDDAALSQKGITSLYQSYVENVARGWLRVDYSPTTYINSISWRSLTDNWRQKLDRKIAVAIYSEWHYLKHYQMDNLSNLRIRVRDLKI
jgi:hypothetical protein